jgi:YVTN family beta-propeller protein
MRRLLPLALIAVALASGLAALPHGLASRVAASGDFVHFESGQVHPLALTPSGDRLLVLNTPDNRLSVYDLAAGAPGPLTRLAEIPVGMEPVSVAARSDSEAWVVNNLSDDVSIVNLNTLHVRATLRVGDEPNDVVFAGQPARAYVSVSQADLIKVFDPGTLAELAPVAVNGRMPRALARTPGGSRVWAAVLQAGNRTSVMSAAEAGDSLPPANPPMSASLPPAPKVGLIVQQQSGDWRDESGKLWNAKAKYSLYDTDLIEITTGSNAVARTFSDLGTVNLALALSPVDSTVALTATEARNLVRFEPNLSGHVVDTRLALVSAGGAAGVVNLNPHVNYGVTPGPSAERDSAIGNPTGAAWSADGQRVYVTALADDKLAVLNAAGTLLARVPTAAGPTGVIVDDARGRIYVLGRFHNQIETLSSATLARVAVAGLGFDPTPDAVVNGRKFFYGGFTSGHGEEACASCHVHGDFDNIAWDLGNPQGVFQPKPPGQVDPLLQGFHPMKGPMTTQTLRGLPNTGLLHWRGDRADLSAFNPAFVGLMGRATQLPDSEMAAFSDFVLALVHPPNPNEFLNRTIPDAPAGTPSPVRGGQFFFNQATDGGVLRCNDCHSATTTQPGTNGQVIDHQALQEAQDIKVPQLRNLYRKTGFTDQPGVTNKRGFGFTHDGAIDNLFDFLHFPGFNFPGGDPQRRDVEAFLLDFDTGLAPAVGYQLTFNGANNGDATMLARLDTLIAQAEPTPHNCDLVAKGRVGGQPRGWLYQGADAWKSDKNAEGTLHTTQLVALAGLGAELTITGVPPGSGTRMGIDRDRDGYLDGDELDARSDPGNPASTPLNVGVPPGTSPDAGLRAARPNPFRSEAELEFVLAAPGAVDLRVFDVSGREVRALARGERFPAGLQRLHWDGRAADGRAVSAGVYYARLRLAGREWTKTLVRVR